MNTIKTKTIEKVVKLYGVIYEYLHFWRQKNDLSKLKIIKLMDLIILAEDINKHKRNNRQ